MMLTFSTKILIIRTALAILLTFWVTVTLPPSCKGLEAAAFTGKLYPEQNKTLQIIDYAATPTYWEPFPTSQLTRVPKVLFWAFIWNLENRWFSKWRIQERNMVTQRSFLVLQGSKRHPVLSESFHICTMEEWEPFIWNPSILSTSHHCFVIDVY